MVYVEKEDEFDVVVDSLDPEGHKRKAEEEQEEEEAIVSIEAIDTVSVVVIFLSLPVRSTRYCLRCLLCSPSSRVSHDDRAGEGTT